MSEPRYYCTTDNQKVDLDFANLGFDYLPCPYRFEAVYELGVWRVRGLLEETEMSLPEGSQSLHYGQQLFEGMKVFSGPDDEIFAFRPEENARRMNDGARYLQGPEVPVELFVRGVEDVTRANRPYVPPFGSGASLYVRPFYLGIGDNVGVKPASRYVFRIFVTPVGPYFKGGFGPDKGQRFQVSSMDRAAPFGTGHIKAGGNYASSFKPGTDAKKAGFAEAIYLDPKEHRFIEEIGAANFLAFRGRTLLTPESHSVLPSITRRSLLQIATDLLEWPVEQRPIEMAELDDIEAAAACGTAAVITWIKEIVGETKTWTFPFDRRWQQLYDTLVGIQTGTHDDPFGWRHTISG